MVIDHGDLVTCVISPVGDTDVFRFSGGNGHTVRLELSDLTPGVAAPCFQLRGPDGDAVGGRVCGSRGRDFALKRTGTHRIVVQELPNAGQQVVRYALNLDRIDPTSPAAVPLRDQKAITEEINREGDLDSYFFAGAAGDRITISIVDRTTGPSTPCFQLYHPDGEPVAEASCGSGQSTHRLEKTGQHSILVTELARDQHQVVAYELDVSCESGICPDLAFEEVLGCLSLRGAPLKGRGVRFSQPDEAGKTSQTNIRGCAKFLPIARKPFSLEFSGPEID